MLNKKEWNGCQYIGKELPRGYRINIHPKQDAINLTDKKGHSCGGVIEDGFDKLFCSNCEQELFPIIKLKTDDPQIAELNLWELPILQVLICPACCLYIEPYWLDFSNKRIKIIGGYKDSTDIKIKTPYDTYKITLRKLSSTEYPVSAKDTYYGRCEGVRHNGICHQVGGLPFFNGYDEMKCFKCKKEMLFAGVIDSEDLDKSNIELISVMEDIEMPICFAIGDLDCLNFFTCSACRVVGVNYIY